MFLPISKKTGALLKQFLDGITCLISWKVSVPELIYSNQDSMTFSTYKPIQIFCAYHYLAHLLKCYSHVEQKIGKCHLQIVLLLRLDHQKD